MFVKTEQGFELIGRKSDFITESLKAGMYSLTSVETWSGFKFFLNGVDRYKNSREIKAGVFQKASQHVKRFFTPEMKEVRKELNMLDKTSLIFVGKPGTGKTHLACVLAEQIVRDNNAIGVVVSSIKGIDFPEMTDKLRINDDPDRMIVYILDELEKNSPGRLTSSEFLSFLDGANSRPNTVIIATANNISELPPFLIERPGRFEEIFEFTFEDEEVLRSTVEGLLPDRLANDEVFINEVIKAATVAKIETIDHLRFLIRDMMFRQVQSALAVQAIEAVN